MGGGAASSREAVRTIAEKGEARNSGQGAKIRAAFATRHQGWSPRAAADEAAAWVQALGGVAAQGVNFAAEERGEGWQLSIVAPRRQCFELSALPLDALAVGGVNPSKVGGVEVGEDAREETDQAKETGASRREKANRRLSCEDLGAGTVKRRRLRGKQAPVQHDAGPSKEALEGKEMVDAERRLGRAEGDDKRRRIVGNQPDRHTTRSADEEIGGHKRRRKRRRWYKQQEVVAS